MDQPITRRDILHGLGAVAASSFVSGAAFANEVLAAEIAGRQYYPPALTGMRGNHDGSFDVAHQLAREGKRDWGPVTEPDSGVYDLVVVGAGLSGLAAAHFYLQDNPQSRILLLDNHDDFGGHARRNEFHIGGRTHIGYGGSQSLESPSLYPKIARSVLEDLSIDIDQLAAATISSSLDGTCWLRESSSEAPTGARNASSASSSAALGTCHLPMRM